MACGEVVRLVLTWRPPWWGRRYTGSGGWELSLDGDVLSVRDGDESWCIGIEELPMPMVRAGLLLSTIDVRVDDRWLVLRGIPTGAALGFRDAAEAAVAAIALRREFDQAARHVQVWADGFQEAARSHLVAKGWLTRDFTLEWESQRPAPRFGALVTDPVLADHIDVQDEAVLAAIELWETDLSEYVADWNETHLHAELEACREFFDRVERSPLTEEQARAVVCFDNRVQVIASAGSGKTSTMVAKAAYALHRRLVAPERILLLAFNNAAAAELRERLRDRLQHLGLPGEKVVAQTFHAFGSSVIGQATGRKPALAPWIDQQQDVEHLAGLIEDLKATDPSFGRRWELFRVVFGNGWSDTDLEETAPDEWQSAQQDKTFRTLQGELVKSQGEQLIADWLFYQGVRYVYEPPYEHDTADATHRQYFPDFYYPDIDVYHEHFGLYRDGSAPKKFEGYLEGVQWKRATHQDRGTELLETTMTQVWDGTAFDYLEEELTRRGITLAPDPDRPIPGRAPVKQAQLVRTFRTFMNHAKSNQLSGAELRERLDTQTHPALRFRNGLFLDLYATIHGAWQQELATHNYIDYDDMLTHAAEHLEAGRWESPYELVMVDEMQDASHARARLARALVAEPGRYLFAVGDDWQSINRFAGADPSVMTDFTGWFGPGQTLRLEQTFRSPQSICDISSAFIQQNPQQLPKHVVSATPEPDRPVTAVAMGAASEVPDVVGRYLEDLNQAVETGAIPAPAKSKLQVRSLSRYHQQHRAIPVSYRNAWAHLEVQAHTIHSSKGLEADYIIILGLTKGFQDFPSTITDDPVLELATPAGETFPFAEERRLFYVALTRTKRAVLLLTVRGKESPFLVELIRDHHIPLRNTRGENLPTVVCPGCGHGLMVQRSGRYGTFFGCSTYPTCRHTMNPSNSAAGHPQR